MVWRALLIFSSFVAGLSQDLPQAGIPHKGAIHPWEGSRVLLPSKAQELAQGLAFRVQAGGEGCGKDRLTGAARQEGDYWSPDGCNNCRCLAGDRASCTGRLCEDQASWEVGRSCSEGARWEEKTHGRKFSGRGRPIQVCSCEGGKPDCNPLMSLSNPPQVRCFDAEKVGGFADGFGSSEEFWEQGGGVCTCQANSTLDCSEEVLGNLTSQCLENDSSIPMERRRLEEVFWQVECKSCRCTGNTLSACSRTLQRLKWKHFLHLPSPACNSGFAVSTSAGPQQCQDENGKKRVAGEEWKEDCNTCWCIKNGVRGCTYKRCPVQLPSDGLHSGRNIV